MGQDLFHFNLTVVLSGHMTILLKFYLWHQKWPKLAPNSPTKWPEITWTSGISIPVRILPLLRSFLVVISLLQFYLWDRKWPKWLQNDQKWAGAVFDQKSGKLSVFRSYNPKFHNLEPKCGSQKSYNFWSQGPPLNPPYPPWHPPGVRGGQKWPKCIPSSPIMIINAKKAISEGSKISTYFFTRNVPWVRVVVQVTMIIDNLHTAKER